MKKQIAASALFVFYGLTAFSKNPVTLIDTVTSQNIDSVLMRPDGAQVAYVAHRADLETNKNPHTLRVVNVRDGSERTLVTSDNLTNVTWAGDGHTLFALAERDGRSVILKVDSETGSVAEIRAGDMKVNIMAAAPNGRVVISSAALADEDTTRRRKEEGLVFEWGRDTAIDIVNRNYTIGEWEDFHVTEPGSNTIRRVYRLKYDGAGRHVTFIEAMRFSPDSRRVAVNLIRRGVPTQGGAGFNFDLGVLDVQTGEFAELLPGSIWTEQGMAWSADSTRMLFVQEATLGIYDVATRQVQMMPWAKLDESDPWILDLTYDSRRSRATARTHRASYTFDLKRRTMKSSPQANAQVELASFDAAFSSYAFIDQASERRPEVAVYDSRRKTTRVLTNLNPWLDGRELGKVEKLEVENASGMKAAAYLVYPVGYQAGQRYPLIIGTYGFVGKFLLGAEWHTTFPSQALAGQGYAVLLLNVPASGQDTANDPVKARDLEGWQMLSTFERAADMMVARGIADPQRLGIYGWSHGGFVVQFLQAHAKTRFRAAAMGEGGDYNPGEYGAFGVTGWPEIFQNMYGGPLSARTWTAYEEFAPVLRIEKFTAPMLMEFSGRAGYFGLEVYVPLRVLKIPAELVTYDDEPHNFVTPRARLASMARKVDWFDFWILGKEDAASAKQEQYVRWRQLRAEWRQ